MRYKGLIGAVLLVVAGYTGFYFFVAQTMVGGIEGWVGAWRAKGGTAEYGALHRQGFPYRIVVDIERPRLAPPGPGTPPAWSTEHLAAVIQPWNFRHVIFDLTSRHRLGPFDTGARRQLDIDLTVGEGLASHRQDEAGRLRDLAVDLKGLTGTATTRVGTGTFPAAITGERAQLHVRRSDGPARTGEVSLRLDQVAVGDAAWMVPVERLAMLAEIGGPEPSPGPPAEMLLAWRDGGGAVEIKQLTLIWGEAEIRAEGTLSLDHETRLIGALTAKVKGHQALLERAVQAGAMRRGDADKALPILNILAAAAGGQLSVPVTLQNGILKLGPVAIARLAPILPRRLRAR